MAAQCSGCGFSVEDAQVVHVGGALYCPACAGRAQAARRRDAVAKALPAIATALFVLPIVGACLYFAWIFYAPGKSPDAAAPKVASVAARTVSIPTTTMLMRNDPPGFRGIAWGTPRSAIPGLMHDGPATWETYVRRSDDLSLGMVRLTKITYWFFHGQFSSVTLDFPVASRDVIMRQLVDTFGYPNSVGTAAAIWHGRVGHVECWWSTDPPRILLSSNTYDDLARREDGACLDRRQRASEAKSRQDAGF